MLTQRYRGYRHPGVAVLVEGDQLDEATHELNTILASHGVEGVEIIVVSDSVGNVIEKLRDFLLSNISFTIEVHIVRQSELEGFLRGLEARIIRVLTRNPSTLETIERLKR